MSAQFTLPQSNFATLYCVKIIYVILLQHNLHCIVFCQHNIHHVNVISITLPYDNAIHVKLHESIFIMSMQFTYILH